MGFFSGKKPPTPTAPAVPFDPKLIAGLLVEAARSDGHYPAAEKSLIDRVLALEFRMEPPRAAQFREAAEAAEAVGETREYVKIARDFTDAQKTALLQTLWRVVLVDRENDYWENAFMKRACKVLHVSDADSKKALKSVEKSLKKKRR